MKRFLLRILVMLYIVVSLGATVTKHYCMGEFVESTLWEKPHCTDCQESKHESSDCCKSTTQLVKLSVDQLHFTLPSLDLSPMTMDLLFDTISQCFLVSQEPTTKVKVFIHSLAKLRDVPIFIHNCTFLI